MNKHIRPGRNSLHFGEQEEWVQWIDASLHFVDRTKQVSTFLEHVRSYDMKKLLLDLDPERVKEYEMKDDYKPIMIPDALCPWGCSKFGFKAVPINPAHIIQERLRDVVLNFPTSNHYADMYLAESSRMDYIRFDDETHDMVLMNKNWEIRPATMWTEQHGLCIMVCRNHSKRRDRKWLYPHPPRKPDGMNLCAFQGDDLRHCAATTRCVSPIRPCKHNTPGTMTTRTSCFAGSDSVYVRFNPRFSGMSYISYQHMALSMAGRPDIHELAHSKVKEGLMPSGLLRDLNKQVASQYPAGSLSQYTRGSTYTPLLNGLRLQACSSESSKIRATVLKRTVVGGEMVEREVYILRSHDPCIYSMQRENPENFGTPIKAVGQYSGREQTATLMTYVLASMISLCNPL